ncbi:hypothetical protein AUC71_04510 [Methyloceanibacter marginalis]|uniref:Uncharacterized protein n=1 Tax=Methyloceanibacter marginalis TaxID=1774971 RepID=A0A1E3VUM6_9HYPH|nr:hypothetical protein AUC71_04510 [Methyloceanibacter marginalis]
MESIIEKEPANQPFADAEQFLDHLDRLEAAEHARHRAEDARFRAGRHGAFRRGLRKQTAVVGARVAFGVGLDARKVVNCPSKGPSAAATSGTFAK